MVTAGCVAVGSAILANRVLAEAAERYAWSFIAGVVGVMPGLVA